MIDLFYHNSYLNGDKTIVCFEYTRFKMHQQRTSASQSSSPLFKVILLAALIVAGVLPYLLIKAYFGKPIRSKMTTVSEQPLAASEIPPINFKNHWVSIKTRSGDSLATIFKRVGLDAQTLYAISQNKKYANLFSRIQPNQPVEFLIKKQILKRMILQIDSMQRLEVVREKDQYQMKLISKKMEVRENYLTAMVQYSLYSTAKRQNIPYKLVQQMTDIFKQEINFAKDVRGGDRFTIIYKANYIGNKMVSIGEIIAVTYTNRGVSHHALRHVNTAGNVDYFTPDGKSMKPGFSRYPVKFSRINSPFSLSRMHPVLHYNRPHRGIDLAAPMGTPIYATGDGRVESLGYESGYGNVIKIAHHNQLYTTVYAHLQKFQKGIFRGGFVKRGQLIGFVGQSGLATGPHCHYELHVNHQPRNPKTVALPTALPVPSRDLAAFKAHADKIIEHLKLFEEAHLHRKYGHAVG